MPPTSKSLPNH